MEINCGNENLIEIFNFINQVIKLIKIFIPILLIIMGSLDLGKAVVAGDDKEIKAAQSLLVKRALYAVAVFFVSTIVNLLIGLVDNDYQNCLKEQKKDPKESTTYHVEKIVSYNVNNIYVS